jgi:hypothetical protein
MASVGQSSLNSAALTAESTVLFNRAFSFTWRCFSVSLLLWIRSGRLFQPSITHSAFYAAMIETDLRVLAGEQQQ